MIPRIDSASLCSLAARYDNPIPSRFLAPELVLKFQHLWTNTKMLPLEINVRKIHAPVHPSLSSYLWWTTHTWGGGGG
jgi:hypothetical protein